MSKTTTLHVYRAFLYISSLFLHDYDVKMPNFAFYEGRKQAKFACLHPSSSEREIKFRIIRNFISFSELGYGPLKFSFRRVRLHLTSRWVRIIAIMTERTQIHFLSYVLVAVASLEFKIPNVELYMKRT